MSTREVLLDGGSPWGFRITGGADTVQPLRIARVNPGSRAAQRGVREGDVISSINNQSAKSISNSDAHALLRTAGETLLLGLNEDNVGSPKRRTHRTCSQQEARAESAAVTAPLTFPTAASSSAVSNGPERTSDSTGPGNEGGTSVASTPTGQPNPDTATPSGGEKGRSSKTRTPQVPDNKKQVLNSKSVLMASSNASSKTSAYIVVQSGTGDMTSSNTVVQSGTGDVTSSNIGRGGLSSNKFSASRARRHRKARINQKKRLKSEESEEGLEDERKEDDETTRVGDEIDIVSSTRGPDLEVNEGAGGQEEVITKEDVGVGKKMVERLSEFEKEERVDKVSKCKSQGGCLHEGRISIQNVKKEKASSCQGEKNNDKVDDESSEVSCKEVYRHDVELSKQEVRIEKEVIVVQNEEERKENTAERNGDESESRYLIDPVTPRHEVKDDSVVVLSDVTHGDASVEVSGVEVQESGTEQSREVSIVHVASQSGAEQGVYGDEARVSREAGSGEGCNVELSIAGGEGTAAKTEEQGKLSKRGRKRNKEGHLNGNGSSEKVNYQTSVLREDKVGKVVESLSQDSSEVKVVQHTREEIVTCNTLKETIANDKTSELREDKKEKEEKPLNSIGEKEIQKVIHNEMEEIFVSEPLSEVVSKEERRSESSVDIDNNGNVVEEILSEENMHDVPGMFNFPDNDLVTTFTERDDLSNYIVSADAADVVKEFEASDIDKKLNEVVKYCETRGSSQTVILKTSTQVRVVADLSYSGAEECVSRIKGIEELEDVIGSSNEMTLIEVEEKSRAGDVSCSTVNEPTNSKGDNAPPTTEEPLAQRNDPDITGHVEVMETGREFKNVGKDKVSFQMETIKKDENIVLEENSVTVEKDLSVLNEKLSESSNLNALKESVNVIVVAESKCTVVSEASSSEGEEENKDDSATKASDISDDKDPTSKSGEEKNNGELSAEEMFLLDPRPVMSVQEEVCLRQFLHTLNLTVPVDDEPVFRRQVSEEGPQEVATNARSQLKRQHPPEEFYVPHQRYLEVILEENNDIVDNDKKMAEHVAADETFGRERARGKNVHWDDYEGYGGDNRGWEEAVYDPVTGKINVVYEEPDNFPDDWRDDSEDFLDKRIDEMRNWVRDCRSINEAGGFREYQGVERDLPRDRELRKVKTWNQAVLIMETDDSETRDDDDADWDRIQKVELAETSEEEVREEDCIKGRAIEKQNGVEIVYINSSSSSSSIAAIEVDDDREGKGEEEQVKEAIEQSVVRNNEIDTEKKVSNTESFSKICSEAENGNEVKSSLQVLEAAVNKVEELLQRGIDSDSEEKEVKLKTVNPCKCPCNVSERNNEANGVEKKLRTPVVENPTIDITNLDTIVSNFQSKNNVESATAPEVLPNKVRQETNTMIGEYTESQSVQTTSVTVTSQLKKSLQSISSELKTSLQNDADETGVTMVKEQPVLEDPQSKASPHEAPVSENEVEPLSPEGDALNIPRSLSRQQSSGSDATSMNTIVFNSGHSPISDVEMTTSVELDAKSELARHNPKSLKLLSITKVISQPSGIHLLQQIGFITPEFNKATANSEEPSSTASNTSESLAYTYVETVAKSQISKTGSPDTGKPLGIKVQLNGGEAEASPRRRVVEQVGEHAASEEPSRVVSEEMSELSQSDGYYTTDTETHYYETDNVDSYHTSAQDLSDASSTVHQFLVEDDAGMWLGTPTRVDPRLLMCLSPSQRRSFHGGDEPTPEDAERLLDLHSKFMQRRAHHENDNKKQYRSTNQYDVTPNYPPPNQYDVINPPRAPPRVSSKPLKEKWNSLPNIMSVNSSTPYHSIKKENNNLPVVSRDPVTDGTNDESSPHRYRESYVKSFANSIKSNVNAVKTSVTVNIKSLPSVNTVAVNDSVVNSNSYSVKSSGNAVKSLEPLASSNAKNNTESRDKTPIVVARRLKENVASQSVISKEASDGYLFYVDKQQIPRKESNYKNESFPDVVDSAVTSSDAEIPHLSHGCARETGEDGTGENRARHKTGEEGDGENRLLAILLEATNVGQEKALYEQKHLKARSYSPPSSQKENMNQTDSRYHGSTQYTTMDQRRAVVDGVVRERPVTICYDGRERETNKHLVRSPSWHQDGAEESVKVNLLSEWLKQARQKEEEEKKASKQAVKESFVNKLSSIVQRPPSGSDTVGHKAQPSKTSERNTTIDKTKEEHMKLRQQIMERRFSLPDQQPQTREDVAAEFLKTSQERIRAEQQRLTQLKRRSLPHEQFEKQLQEVQELEDQLRQYQQLQQQQQQQQERAADAKKTEVKEKRRFTFSDLQQKYNNPESFDSQIFDAKDYKISKQGDIAVIQLDKEIQRLRPVQRPKSTPEAVVLGGETFRQQMYNEYMQQVAQRAERRRQKVLKISAIPTKDEGFAMSPPDTPEHRLSVARLENEFMDRVRERMDKLGMRDDGDGGGGVDYDGGYERRLEEDLKSCSEVSDTLFENWVEDYVIEGDVQMKGLPRHLQEFLSLTADGGEGGGVWYPGLNSAGSAQNLTGSTPHSAEQTPTSPNSVQQSINRLEDSLAKAKEDVTPTVWTPKSAGASPQLERKEFRPVNFESPTLQRKTYASTPKSEECPLPSWQQDSVNSPLNSFNSSTIQSPTSEKSIASSQITSSIDKHVTQTTERRFETNERRLTSSQSAPASGLFSLASSGIKLPRVQNPTITLLQKAREGQLPRGALYLDHKMSAKEERELERERKSDYESDTQEVKRKSEPRPKVEGIGPTTKEGMPIVLRSEVKDENHAKWYKKMYDSLHRAGKDDEYVTVRYRPRRGKYPYTSAGGYLSEPDHGGYDSDLNYSSKYATLDRRRIKNKENDYTSSMPRNRYVPHPDSIRYATEVYRNQPGRIENYEPGNSSIADKEAKQWWDEVLDIFDGAAAEQEKQQRQQHSSSTGKTFMTHALKESGYESDSTLVFKRRDDNQSSLSPAEHKMAYKSIQKGGEVPHHGFRKMAPERPRESPHRYVESEVTIHYRSPVRAEAKESMSEEELARVQAEAMRRIYQENRRRKYLQELQDMNSRRHTDNFTPSQKSPIPLNRYDDFLDDPPTTRARSRDRTPEPKLVARALYNFQGQTSRELSFRRGDIIFVRRQIDKNWYEGEHNAMIGLFPFNYVEIIPYDGIRTIPRKPTEGQARAKFNFIAQTHLELSLVKGELVVLTRRVDDNWFEGRIGARKGIFPVSYVDVLYEPGQKPVEPIVTSTSAKPIASPASHSLLINGKPATGQPLFTPQTSTNKPLHVDTHSDPIPYCALYNYRPQNADELELREGDTVFVMEKCDDGWYVGSSHRTGQFGTFPGNYVQRI